MDWRIGWQCGRRWLNVHCWAAAAAAGECDDDDDVDYDDGEAGCHHHCSGHAHCHCWSRHCSVNSFPRLSDPLWTPRPALTCSSSAARIHAYTQHNVKRYRLSIIDYFQSPFFAFFPVTLKRACPSVQLYNVMYTIDMSYVSLVENECTSYCFHRLPYFCQKLSELVEIWRSYDKNNLLRPTFLDTLYILNYLSMIYAF